MSHVVLPLPVCAQGAPPESPAEDGATIEVERLDAADLGIFFPEGLDRRTTAQTLSELVGPLEQRSRRAGSLQPDVSEHTRPSVLVDSDLRPDLRSDLRPGLRQRPWPATAHPTGATTRSFLRGPARWLVPLGLLTAATLGLALWVLFAR